MLWKAGLLAMESLSMIILFITTNIRPLLKMWLTAQLFLLTNVCVDEAKNALKQS